MNVFVNSQKFVKCITRVIQEKLGSDFYGVTEHLSIVHVNYRTSERINGSHEGLDVALGLAKLYCDPIILICHDSFESLSRDLRFTELMDMDNVWFQPLPIDWDNPEPLIKLVKSLAAEHERESERAIPVLATKAG